MGEEIRYFELNTGAKFPSVGLGTWQSEPGLVGQAVEVAIKSGYHHIDCARAYENEKEIGLVLKKLFDDGVVKREDLFITSKLRSSDQAPEDVSDALGKTLEDLQLDYVDLYLIHWPVRMKKGSVGFGPENLVPTDIPGTWKVMEALYDAGKARAIGVSNFSVKKLGDLLDIARVPPAVNQVECHPSWQQAKLREFCKSKGVHLSGYSPLGSPGTTWLKSEVLCHPVLVSTAEKLGKTPAQIALRWGLQMGNSLLPKSTKESRIKENFAFLAGPYRMTYLPNSLKSSRRDWLEVLLLSTRPSASTKHLKNCGMEKSDGFMVMHAIYANSEMRSSCIIHALVL